MKKKFYKGKLSKVIHNDIEYVRMFHAEELPGNKHVLLNAKVFRKISDTEYIPFYYEKIKDIDNELFRKLTVCVKSEYIPMETYEINNFLDSLISYTDKTFNLVTDSIKKISPNADISIYKEYMGVYYTIVLENGLGTLYEVVIEDDSVGFRYVADKLVDKILIEEFPKYIRNDLELYIKVSTNKVIALTLASGKRCYMEVVITEHSENSTHKDDTQSSEANSNKDMQKEDSWQFDLTRMKFLETVSQEEMQEALRIASDKVEAIADLFM